MTSSQSVPESSVSIGPEQIRALRGEESRAAFARRLGVTPLTVYRWELADGAPQARRPRGAELGRLRALLQTGELPGAEPPKAIEPARAFVSDFNPDEAAEEHLILALINQTVQGDWRGAESELMGLLAGRKLSSAVGRAGASAALSFIQLGIRSELRAAFSTLLPALNILETIPLSPLVAALIHVVAAHVYASADGRLLDVGRSHVHASRAAELAPDSPEIQVLAWLAKMAVALTVGDDELLSRVFSRVEVLEVELPPLLQGYRDEARGLHALFTGKAALAGRRFEDLAHFAASQGYALLEARALAHWAMRRLEDLADPHTALEQAERALRVAQEGRLGPGIHLIFAACAKGSAMIRLARFEESYQAFGAGDAVADEMLMPPIGLATFQTHLGYVTGNEKWLRQVARKLQDCQVTPVRAHAQGTALYVEAIAEMVANADRKLPVELLIQAEQTSSWLFLRRQIALFKVIGLVLAGDLEGAQVALRRAQRFQDEFPTPTYAVMLRRFEGVLWVFQQRWSEGRQLLEAAVATFTAAGDLPDAAVTRRIIAQSALVRNEPDAEALVRQSEAELRQLGMPTPSPFQGKATLIALMPEKAPRISCSARMIDSFVVPIQRLMVRGAGVLLLQKELLAVLSQVFPHSLVRLEEIDSEGRSVILGQKGQGDESALDWVEFGDGTGRRLRAGIEGPLAEQDRAALTALTSVASLALEVAALRGFAESRSQTLDNKAMEPEIPGFIASSPAMRRLRCELVRLSSSRSTVIITGESGVGKEVVARVLHDLSARATRPYVAFNCASVPRDLFEGQLFGYRKGAFTGAQSDQPGVIRAADGGSLFLDEVGELPLDIQPKLLRFLENGEVFPLGEKRPMKVDVRVIAATHRDLSSMVKAGQFREDLYYRLQVVPLHIPALRERKEDLISLARHFLRLYTPQGEEPPVLSPDALSALGAHLWPGNVRELRNVIERSMAFAPLPRVLTSAHLRM